MNLHESLHIDLGKSVDFLENMLKARLVPMLHGSPAIGKSAAIHAIAKKLNLEMIDVRFAGFDPTDLQGFPTIDKEKDISRYVPMETFPLDDWTIPEGKSGWLVFCDELTSAIPAVQVASYKFFLDRAVGQRKLHPQAYVIAAGNLATDGAVVEDMSSALISRLGHIVVKEDLAYWLKWAQSGNISPLICSYLEYLTGNFYTFDPENADQPYASPRTWEMVNSYLKVIGGDPRGQLVPMAGLVNLKPAQDLITFADVWASLPKRDEVMANPDKAYVPGYDKPGALYALCGAVGDWLTKDNIDKLMPYINRIEADFQAVLLRGAARRKPELLGHPLMSEWVTKNASLLL